MQIKSEQFITNLENTLKHYLDPVWLGDFSALASPYILGHRLPATATSPQERGRVLQQVLQEATGHLNGKYAERHQALLQKYYFEALPLKKVYDLFGLTHNAFNKSRKDAIHALAQAIINLLHPALQLEQPPQSACFFERQAALERCLDLLKKQQSMAVIGANGIGKSLFAATLTRLQSQPVFWYTLRPGLNDRLESFVFALGLFAHQQGASSLWMELVASSGKLLRESSKMLALLRHTFQEMRSCPLICIDAIEQLNPGKDAAHQNLISLLEELKRLSTLIVIGEQAIVEVDHYESLGGLSLAGIQQWGSQAALNLSPRQELELLQLSQGNPRLLTLFAASWQGGEAIHDLLHAFTESLNIEMWLNRLCQRLSEPEQQILAELSVFRNPVPMFPWQSAKTGYLLDSLLAKNLIQHNGQGAIEIPSALRSFFYRRLTPQQKRQCHLHAASIRSSYGAYTATVWHLLQADEILPALLIWQEHKTEEIRQGQAEAALKLLHSLLAQQLPPDWADMLRMECSALSYHVGNIGDAMEELRPLIGKTSPFAAEASELAGRIQNDLSQFDAAEESLRQTIRLTHSLAEIRAARAYKGIAWNYARQRQIPQAVRELDFAHYEIENMRGNLASDQCEYALAAQHYQSALSLAEAINHPEGIAKTCNNLGLLNLRLGSFAQAEAQLDRAATLYQSLGKADAMIGCRITRAVGLNLARRFTDAQLVLQKVEQEISQQSQPRPWQLALLQLGYAECYLGLGNPQQALHYAQLVIDAEEIDLLPDAYRVRGEALTASGRLEDAEKTLQVAIRLAEQNEDDYLTAYAWRAIATLYRQQGKAQAATEAQQNAIDLFRQMGLENEVTR